MAETTSSLRSSGQANADSLLGIFQDPSVRRFLLDGARQARDS
jgi:hypothetical protein